MAYAHSREDSPKSEWHSLEEHLRSTAVQARRFAEGWGAGEIAFVAGLWHDLGKYAPDWQRFLSEAGVDAPVASDDAPDSGKRRGPDHSTAGAIHCLQAFGEKSYIGSAIASTIAAHHMGLSNRSCLRDRLSKPEKRTRYEKAHGAVPAGLLDLEAAPAFPGFLAGSTTTPAAKAAAWTRLEVFIRMLFSALVDADFLDTERFYKSGDATAMGSRPTFRPVTEYLAALEAHLARFSMAPVTPVVVQRQQVLGWCRRAALGPRGAYSLTVPTGGGKTLSSLAFALRHAEKHGLRRVVVALPFLSILDQTADVFRDIFEKTLGGPALIEHHSNVTAAHDTVANRLAAENWDAPLVVTTQVQLFESLFSNRSRDCRKLHNLANSVVILDEVQTLPAELLAPILDQLQELRAHYGVTLVLTTATQPALHSRRFPAKVFAGLEPAPVEIVPPDSIQGLFEALRRVEVEWPGDDEPRDWPGLAEELAGFERVLAIVHRRQDAVDLWRACEAIRPGEWTHLSALMCPEHRRKVLAEIRRRLAAGEPCRVVSTQLVEAGVDVDFPVVFRAMAGLESLAQSAGRCNREGRLPGRGRFVVFNPETDPPALLKQHRDLARVMLRARPGLDLMAPATFREYFDTLYASRNLDAKAIQPLREELKFDDVASTFRMIENVGETVFVPYGKSGRAAIQALRYGGPSRDVFRMLQPFGVTVYPDGMKMLLAAGAAELLPDPASVHVLVSDIHYDETLGLITEPGPTITII